MAGLATVLVVISQTNAFFMDEGFHLVASWLITHGRQPYVDFAYAQAPMYAYLNAYWMQLFGDTWRSSHALSALLCSGAVAMVVEYLLGRFRNSGAFVIAALGGVLLVGNGLILQTAGLSQPYAECLFWTVAAFRLAVTTSRTSFILFASGVCAGVAGASSLLAAPVIPVIFLWTVWTTERGARLRVSLRFLAGVTLALLPLAYLVALAPRQSLFDVIEFHLFYRQIGFPGADLPRWNLAVVGSALASPQAVLLAVFFTVGLLSQRLRDVLGDRVTSEVRLSAWLAAALGLYLCVPTPTFSQYFVLVVPFACIVAAAGVASASGLFGTYGARSVALVVVLMLYCAPAARVARAQWTTPRSDSGWTSWEAVAKKVDSVAPNGSLYSEWEGLYFLTRRLPPRGAEYADTQKLGPDLAAIARAASEQEVDSWLSDGRFDVVVMWDADPRIGRVGLRSTYPNSDLIGQGMRMFWRSPPQ